MSTVCVAPLAGESLEVRYGGNWTLIGRPHNPIVTFILFPIMVITCHYPLVIYHSYGTWPTGKAESIMISRTEKWWFSSSLNDIPQVVKFPDKRHQHRGHHWDHSKTQTWAQRSPRGSWIEVLDGENPYVAMGCACNGHYTSGLIIIKLLHRMYAVL